MVQEFEGEATALEGSTNGCRAASTIKWAVGVPLRLSLFLPDAYEWLRRVKETIVRWVDGRQLGLELAEIRLAQRGRMSALSG
ncbi:MAG: hypothetical protein HP492_15945 [Nitrospira sp.]|nr:hypothetical protein [Nitrospira sp.]